MAQIGRRLSSGRTRGPALAALYLIGAAAPRFAAFLLLPVYAFELSPAELAAYGIAISIAQLIGILCDAGVLDGMGILYWEQREEDKRGFLMTTVVLSRVVSLVLMVPAGLLLAAFWDALFGDGLSLQPGLFLVLTFAFLQRGNTLAGAVYRVQDHHSRFAATKVVPAAVQVLAGLVYVFVLHWGALGAVAAAPTGFLVSILVAGALRSRAPVRFARLTTGDARRIMGLGLPVIPESLAKWAQMLSLRPLLALNASVAQTAAFTFANAPAQVVSPFTEAYEQYVVPKYYDSSAKRDLRLLTRLREMTSVFGGLGAIGTVAAIVVMDPLFRGLAPTEYRDTAGLAAIGLAGILMRSPMSLLVHNLRVENMRLALVSTVVVGLTVSYAQFFALVGELGATSAAWSIYVYPAVACAVMLAVRRDRAVQMVRLRDFLLTHAVVLVVLVTMLAVTPTWHGSAAYWLTMLGVGLLGALVLAWSVVWQHLATLRSLLRDGVGGAERAPVG